MNRYSNAAICCILTVAFLFFFTNSFAKSEVQISEELIMVLDTYTFVNAEDAAIKGPKKIDLLDQATLDLKEGYAFIPKNEAMDISAVIGNPGSDKLIGLVVSTNFDWLWIAYIYFEKTGYISDYEAKSWKPDEILKDIKYLTEEANKEIDRYNISKSDVLGWIKPPSYDPKTNQLTWSTSIKEMGLTPNKILLADFLGLREEV